MTDAWAIQEGRRTNGLFAWWSLWITVVTLLLWVAFQEGSGRYIIYATPILVASVYLVLNRSHPRFDGAAVMALALYAAVVLATLAVNPHLTFFAQRDLLIIFGYIAVFCLHMEAPAAVADVVLVALTAGLAIQASDYGIGAGFSFGTSQGLVESGLAFPIGAVLIYYVSARRWGRALLAAVVLFLAFKRIAMLGVGVAVALDFLTRRWSLPASRRAFVGAVVLACLVALFSLSVFDYLANAFGSGSAEAVSLGRYDIATVLWSEFAQGGLLHRLFGFGPGAADAAVIRMAVGLDNPHNDWLKILVDYGAVGLILWHGILARLFPRNRLGNQIYLYGAVLMITDNTLIYLFHFMVVFLISRIRADAVPVRADRREGAVHGLAA